MRTVKQDDVRTLRIIARAFNCDHFNITKLHRCLYPKRAPQWIPFDQDELRKDMRRLVMDGLAENSTGPRGGEGWKLTDSALRFVNAQQH